ncbi:MAG: hypothetical protein HQK50_05280 [Oligoflexia bacterium]|nr:hypothetical protein [Oligoflexia bacterium]MBF0364961.1 hypothetical protein [Oligoflexia bacterium]
MIPKIHQNPNENPYAVKNKHDSPERKKEREREQEKEEKKKDSQDHHAIAYSQKHKGVVIKEHLAISHQTMLEVTLNKSQIIHILEQLNTHNYYKQKGISFLCPSFASTSSAPLSPDCVLSELHFEIIRDNKLVQRLSGEMLYNLYLKIEQEHSSASVVNLLDISC